ncbi:MAG TPA: prepilin-type N-terminal cleavage/methylation domain-containing protein [Opitutaceae bacterium]|nr:prepilin-type N-terminal cleavage/methylation domain-containing protein [Opitutaceae bacterium]
MTTSATGEPGGFTLIEILLALALIALLGTIFISGTNSLLAERGASPDSQFWKACAQARKQALEEQRSVLLSYDPRTRAFVMNDGAQQNTLPVPGPEDLVIDFHPAQSSSSSSILLGGTLVETQLLASVTFYDDGTCTPFRVQIRTGAGAHLLSIDPWTCAPVLAKSDAAP